MAKAGHVNHWKHGWIPISPEAKAFVAGRGPRPALRTDGKTGAHTPITWSASPAKITDAEKAEVQGYVDSYLVDRFPGAAKGHRCRSRRSTATSWATASGPTPTC
jgi:hypothetical protein